MLYIVHVKFLFRKIQWSKDEEPKPGFDVVAGPALKVDVEGVKFMTQCYYT